MRYCDWAAALAVWTFLAAPATAGFRDDVYNCRIYVTSAPDRSIAACRAAIGLAERAPELLNEANRADLWFQMALAFEAKGDRTSAISALDSAVATYAEDKRFYWLRARQWQALGKCDKAIADLGTQIRLLQNPKPGYSTDKSSLYQAYMSRGGCHEQLRAMKLATDNYDLALAVFPGDRTATDARNRVAASNQASPTTAVQTSTPPNSAPNPPALKPAGPALTKRVALIIGNSQYLYTNNLPNAVNDAADVAAALKAKGYTIYGYPRVNLHREDMFSVLDEFVRAASDADIAFVWYAGHGQQMSDPGEPARNWLFPVDFKGGTDLDRGAVPLTKLLSAAQAAKRLRVVVVDACRNTTLQSGARAARGFRPEPRADMVVVYSTSAGNIADDGDPAVRNSPFAAAFLETFKTHANLDVRQFFGGVSEGVRMRTRTLETPQQPELMSNLNTMETMALAP